MKTRSLVALEAGFRLLEDGALNGAEDRVTAAPAAGDPRSGYDPRLYGSFSVSVKVRARLQTSCDPPVVALLAYAFRSDAFELLIRDARTPDADFDGFDLSRSN